MLCTVKYPPVGAGDAGLKDPLKDVAVIVGKVKADGAAVGAVQGTIKGVTTILSTAMLGKLVLAVTTLETHRTCTTG